MSDEQDENNLLKKKHQANIKDLTRHLYSLQKKHMLLSTTQNSPSQISNSQSNNYEDRNSKPNISSRTNSITSLTDNESNFLFFKIFLIF